MIRTRRSLVALSAILAIVLAACGSSSGSQERRWRRRRPPPRPRTAPTSGNGTLVIGAEQEMDCADWIASCAGSSWGTWAMMDHTMPRVFEYEKVRTAPGQNVPSILMASPPTVDQGQRQADRHVQDQPGTRSGPTSSRSPRRTSSTPGEQIATGKDIYDKTGYDKIESVDSSNPKTAVVTFKTPYGSWPGLFGGGLYGILPSHLLEGKNRVAR